jgi:hypothetical protein
MANDILKKIDELLGGEHGTNPGGAVPYVVKTAGITLDRDERRSLKAAQARWESGFRAVEASYPSKAAEAWRLHSDEVAAGIANGTVQPDCEVWGKSEWEQEFRERLAVAKAACQSAANEAKPVTDGIVKRVVDAGAKLVADIEAKERSLCAEVGVEFVPSVALKALAGAVRSIEGRIGSSVNWSSSPARQLEGIATL